MASKIKGGGLSLNAMLTKQANTNYAMDSLLGHKFGHTVFGKLTCCGECETGHEPVKGERSKFKPHKPRVCPSCNMAMSNVMSQSDAESCC